MLGLPLLLVALAVGGYVFVQHSKSSGPSAPAITQMETQASVAVAGANFSAVAEVLQGWYAQNGTYAGATVPPGSGVILVKADDSGLLPAERRRRDRRAPVWSGRQVQPGPC